MSNSLKGKRILALIYGTELYGNERGNLEALNALKKEGATIRLGVSNHLPGGGDVGKTARNLGFTTFQMPFGSHFAFLWMKNDRKYRNTQFKKIWLNSRILAKEIDTFNPDFLHIGSVLPFIFCFLSFIIRRTPMIFRIGDAPPTDSRFQMFWWRRMIRRSKQIVCISHFIQQEVQRHFKKDLNIRVIHNLAPKRRGAINDQKMLSLEQSKKTTQLVFVGQINPNKGIDILIEALLQVDDKNLGCWIIGDTSDQEFKAKLTKEVFKSISKTNIQFTGFALDPRPFLRVADWNITPSVYQEPLGNVVQEAANEGTPSIISNLGGLPELIEDGITGLILNETSVDKIAACLGLVMKNPDWSNRMGKAAFSRLSRQTNEKEFKSAWKYAYTEIV